MVEKLYDLPIALVAGIIIALAGYYLNIIFANRERKEKAKEQLQGAMRSILVEIEANLGLAKQPFKDTIMLPFLTEMWDYHKGEILALPPDMQTAIHQTYICIREANAIVQNNIHLPYGLGYYNSHYETKKSEIAEKANIAIKLCRGWFDSGKKKELK
jgi:hypothetical protein